MPHFKILQLLHFPEDQKLAGIEALLQDLNCRQSLLIEQQQVEAEESEWRSVTL